MKIRTILEGTVATLLLSFVLYGRQNVNESVPITTQTFAGQGMQKWGQGGGAGGRVYQGGDYKADYDE